MLKRKSKRVLSIVLAVAMIVGLFPIAAFADNGTTIVSDETGLKEALNANTTSTIVLSQDITVDEQLTVNGSYVLDLGSHTLTSRVNQHAILVKSNANLTVQNGTLVLDTDTSDIAAINSESASTVTLAANATINSDKAGILCGNDKSNVDSKATLNVYGKIDCNDVGVWSYGGQNTITIDGATIDSCYFGVYQNGSAGGSTFNIINSTIRDSLENGAGIYISNSRAHEKQTVVIENSVITGATGVEVKFTNVDISGENTKITATKTPADVTQSGNGSTTVGYAFALSHNGTETTKDAADGIVSIKNGSFDGLVDIMEPTLGAETKGDITVTGGTFSNVNTDKLEQFIPEGNKLDENGSVAIDETEAVASVDGVGYTSLQEAINAAPAGGTVTLVRGFTLDAPSGLSDGQGAVTIEKNITIDGNDKTITAGIGFTKNAKGTRGQFHIFNIQNAGNVVIKDLTIEGKSEAADSVPRSGINIWSPTGATTLTVENVTVNNCSTYGLTASGTNVDVVLNGLTTNGNGWGGVNIDTQNGGDVALTVTNADLNEVSSIVFDKGTGATKDPVATINGGNFENLVVNKGAESTKLLINGGRFNPNAATPSGGTVIDIEKHLASGLEYNPWTGEVYKEPEYTGKYSYEIFTTVGDNGAIDVDRYATEGDDVTITVSPDEAYLLDELTVTTGGKEVEVKDNGDGTYTFKMPSADAKIVVTFAEDPDWEPEPEEPAMPFTDVNEGDWFYDVVLYAYDNGLMTGVSATEFAPNQTTTRGMIVSMLARLEGVTSAEDAGFADVAENDWYATAVNWAASVGVVNGYEDNTFRPNAPITREQMAAILYNYADYKGYDVSARANLSDYADAADVSSWAEDVLSWANAEGLIKGMTTTTIAPQGETTRAQTAAMFERFLTAHEA